MTDRSDNTSTASIDLNVLTESEREEIKPYQPNNVYYVGQPGAKPTQPDASYDDENGFYIVRPHDHVAYRYEILKAAGKGSFAHVIKAIDRKDGGDRKVAIKVVRSGVDFQQLLSREMDILKYLKRADPDNNANVVHLLEEFHFRGHHCLVFELLYTNLYNVMRSNGFKGLTVPVVKKITVHMLNCLEFLHSAGVVHADLKPENIMLREQKRSAIKIIDFGWSWILGKENQLSSYFQSRFYRAPEVVLRGPLTPAVDMWSFGLIVAEIASGSPIFQGEDKHDQLASMIEVLGVPPVEFTKQCAKSKLYFSPTMEPYYCRMKQHQDTCMLIGSATKSGGVRGVPGSKHIRAALLEAPGAPFDADFIDFLLRCLEWNPSARLTASEAKMHRWIAETVRMENASRKIT